MSTVMHYELSGVSFLSLERTTRWCRNPQSVRTNADRQCAYRNELRKRGLLPSQRPVEYEEVVVRLPKLPE